MTTSTNFGAFTSYLIGNHHVNEPTINHMPASVKSAGSTVSSLPRERSITPRHVFTSLDEAHQAITTRAAKQAAHITDNGAHSALIPGESSAGSSVNAVYSKSTTDADEHSATESHRCPTHDGFSRGRRISPTHLRRRSSSVPDFSTRTPPYPDWEEMTPAARASYHAAKDPVDNNTPDNSINTPRETGSTVENIVDQYLPSATIDSSPSADGQHNQSTNDASVHHSLDNGETVEPPQTRENITSVPFGCTSKLYRIHGSPPRIPQPPIPAVNPSVIRANLPEDHTSTPECHNNIFREHSWSTMSTASSVDIKNLLDNCDENNVGTFATSRKGNHYVEASRHESNNNQAARETTTGSGALPNAAFSTGGLTTDSDDDPFKYDRGSYTVFLQPSREREVSAALHRVSGVSTTCTNKTDQTGHASATRGPVGSAEPPMPPSNGLTYYNSVQRDNNIPNKRIMKKLDLRSYPAQHLAWDDEFDEEFDENLDAVKTDGGDWETVGSNLDAVKSDGGEWETVGSSVGQFNSHRAYASGTGFGNHFGLRTTGSSIADYSDASSLAETFGAFASTEKIMQHPMNGKYDNYVIRTLKGDNRPVFLPQPRIHRVNGYPQDSCRLFDQATASSSQGSSTRAYLAEKLTAPFRSLTFNKNIDRRHPYGSNQSGPDSDKQRRDHGLEIAKLPPQTPRAHDSLQADKSFGPESPVQFSFPLIPLEEAARLQAMKRRSDANDHTFQSSTRTRKDSLVSCISWKASNKLTKRVAPSTPHTLPRKPLPTHCHEPVSNHRLSIRMYDPGSTYQFHVLTFLQKTKLPARGGRQLVCQP
ncbi:uncharacterized protein B0T23DRAFT_72811 [Neurospora hispaniola]|uniref:Uncharacterized protein n=1 Tax=Neurospora hispaniola TaxID=588809 RepID=A0AAJ0MTY1_9PEZI|nr:hypothetical protein B0T23DRAFT_72811 [Neurospora hispaniola]